MNKYLKDLGQPHDRSGRLRIHKDGAGSPADDRVAAMTQKCVVPGCTGEYNHAGACSAGVAFDPLTAGQGEGWGLFTTDVDEKCRALQKDDESDRFETDAEAIAYVRARADAGSALHQAALIWADL